jgi:hypothetical protein
VEVELRQRAESAYEFIHQQSQPLRAHIHSLHSTAEAAAKDRSESVKLGAAVCIEALQVVAADVRRHFGFIPREMQNKIDLVRSVCLKGRWLCLV